MKDRTFVTGFGAFQDIAVNPSSKLAETCGRPFRNLEVAFQAVDDFVQELSPATFDRLLMLGVASSRDRLTPELFARNMLGPSKDVRGYAREGFIVPEAPLLLESTLWTPQILSEIVAYDPHTKISMDAGEYLCNYISYRALQRFPDKQVGFLHVPSESHLPLAEQSATLERILSVIER